MSRLSEIEKPSIKIVKVSVARPEPSEFDLFNMTQIQDQDNDQIEKSPLHVPSQMTFEKRNSYDGLRQMPSYIEPKRNKGKI